MKIVQVTDHGLWRGHRSWTVVIDGPTGRAQVSARDVDTEPEAIAQARETYTNRRVFSAEEKEALARQAAALRRGLS